MDTTGTPLTDKAVCNTFSLNLAFTPDTGTWEFYLTKTELDNQVIFVQPAINKNARLTVSLQEQARLNPLLLLRWLQYFIGTSDMTREDIETLYKLALGKIASIKEKND